MSWLCKRLICFCVFLSFFCFWFPPLRLPAGKVTDEAETEEADSSAGVSVLVKVKRECKKDISAPPLPLPGHCDDISVSLCLDTFMPYLHCKFQLQSKMIRIRYFLKSKIDNEALLASWINFQHEAAVQDTLLVTFVPTKCNERRKSYLCARPTEAFINAASCHTQRFWENKCDLEKKKRLLLQFLCKLCKVKWIKLWVKSVHFCIRAWRHRPEAVDENLNRFVTSRIMVE